MHGRTIALSALLMTFALCAPAARADETLTPGQPATADGVVTAWSVTSPTAQTARLATVQELAGGPLTTATSAPASLVAGAQTLSARVPIAAGGTVSVLDASGTSGLQATVEPDRDGDAYGDTTQDPCPADFTAHARPCGLTLTFGSPLTLAPDPRGFSGSGSPIQALQPPSDALATAVGTAGILTRWRLRSATAAGDTVLQVLRPDPTVTTFTVVDESAPIHVTSTDVTTVAAAIAVRPGDRLAARSVAGGGSSDLGAVAYSAGDTLRVRQPPVAKGGAAFTVAGTYPDRRLLVQADVEPDADGDGRGDVSQDSANVGVVVAQDGAGQRYTVTNAGPDAALRLSIRIEGAGGTHAAPAGAACAPDAAAPVPGGVTTVCTLARLDKGASAAFTTRAAQTADAGGLLSRSSASATALTPDPDATDNAATWSVLATPYVPNLPPQAPFVAPPCGHVIKGTRDDDVLRGTVFGDRLVGSEGRDLLKGGGGDDCLEGGTGNDVLDGGDGNDRLAGASGRDRLAGGTGNDKLTGGRGNDRLTGGPGDDVLSPGDGHDSIDAGSGNDTINAVDGVRETVDCGRGRDTVRADRRDRLEHCEKVTRRR